MLTERFSQDPLENYFGPMTGNVRGIDEANIEFTNEPIPCRKKAKSN